MGHLPSIRLRTEIPGPRSRELMQRRIAAVPQGPSHATSIFVARSEGATLEDVDGNQLLDFAGGIGCLNVGHRAQRVLAAAREQMDRYLHVCFSVTPYEGYVALAEKLNSLAPGKFAKKTLLVNSGAEAVENAIKIARSYTRRPAVICFEDAFHGRTLMAMSVTSKTHPYKTGFGPFATDVHRIPYAYCYRCAYSKAYPSCGVFCAHHLQDTFKRVVAAESVAAVIVEPVLGEGGFVVPPAEFLPTLRDYCSRNGILLIADEVQSGFGRTGAFFACERLGLEPDLLVCAKSLGGGFPLAAVTGRSEVMDASGRGSLGGTFGGHPVSCAAALATIETLERDELLARSDAIGERFHVRAAGWQQRWPMVGQVRGIGAMRAIELVRSPETREPAKDAAKAVASYCHQHGLVILTAGTYENVIRVLVPLTVTDQQLEEGLAVMEAGLASVLGESGNGARQCAAEARANTRDNA